MVFVLIERNIVHSGDRYGGGGCVWRDGPARRRHEDPRHSQKPMRYKDVVREQILQARSAEEAISSDEDDEGREGGEEGRGRKELAYDEEQEELRKGFLGSVAEINSRRGGEGSDEEGDGNGLLKVSCCCCFAFFFSFFFLRVYVCVCICVCVCVCV